MRALPTDGPIWLAWLPWLLLYSVVLLFILCGSERTVTPLYFEAAENWRRGEGLYVAGGRGFLYLPQAAILAIPFQLLPRIPGEIAWRFISIGTFALGILRLSRVASKSHPNTMFAVMSCLAAPLAWSSALNGQSTLPMAGLMMLATGELVDNRSWRGAALLALALAVKPLALVMLLVAASLWPKMFVRLLVVCAAMLAVPFLLQSPEYVAGQYAACLTMLRDAARLGAQKPWAQLFGMLQVAHIEFSESVQMGMRLLAAVLTLAAAWHAQRRLEASRALLYVYALATCYLMLFNPRTENNSYAMLAPAIGWCCAEAFLIERRARSVLVYIIIALGTVGSHEFGRHLIPTSRAVWLAPLMAVWFTGVLSMRLLRETRRELRLPGGSRITLTSVSRAALHADPAAQAEPAGRPAAAEPSSSTESLESSRLAESAADTQ